ncbi:serine--glyoxylate transaminase, putative [Oceanicola granulosus HTCC2516]|uniref:Serine--glyoxylate transaminase, putative n=1 Tax=Oceanicola granulosus (strain ATCC BAA-861 / DSM 15982 / KCTC 12143 / HTCC2516) TaxID=314256 RepID=Q2CA12_OCEGH|nr:aminotransferase class V-fold PLP-dependent enzyme [Oceanicola granulosus]EAR49525.1 serine--glyoxylate transaminase, putative [Oceanicola granulosus HTCC2516]
MTLAAGRHYLAIPGPSVMPDPVLAAMHRPAPNIYEGELVDMTATIAADLKRIAVTEHQVAIYIANGHGAWEAALANVCAPGETVLCCVTGRFGEGWAEMARGLGLVAEEIDFGLSSALDAGRIEAALREDRAGRIRAVLVNHVDTATTVRNDIAAVRAAIDAAGHPALLMVDCIASLGCDPFEMDALGADVVVAASQKGLMTPPGLGFLFFNERADAVQRANKVSGYWSWTVRARPEMFYQFFGGTAPTHHLYGLRTALDMLLAEGLEAIWHRHEVLSGAIWAAVDAWGQGGAMRLNVPRPEERSFAVTSVHLPEGKAEELRRFCSERLGVTLGIGLGRDPGVDYLRVGHMGHVNAHMVLGVVGVMEAGMAALSIPFGPGAGSAAAEVVARGC